MITYHERQRLPWMPGAFHITMWAALFSVALDRHISVVETQLAIDAHNAEQPVVEAATITWNDVTRSPVTFWRSHR